MMDARGFLDSERAPISSGKDVDFGPMYQRSLPLSTVFVKVPPETRPTWFATAQLNSGYFDFDPYAEDGVIKSVRCKGDHFDAYTLLKANNAEDGDCSFLVGPNFYPALHKMLRQKKDWGKPFCFRGRATFEHGILEWTETVLQIHEETLHQAGIFGAVAVSRYPYEHCNNVWRAFCELWGPLTNTFHHAGGEMSVSLYDLNIIGGLPISGKPYEEFIPPNAALLKAELYPSSVAELLRIYSDLSAAYQSPYVYWSWWIEHFYRGSVIYGAYGDCKNTGASTLRKPKLELEATKKGKLAAFLAFWLSRFVLPFRGKKIRPETFYMASLMAEGVRVSLAPTVLGYIYHGLGEMATHPEGPGTSDSCLPIHYVIGWFGEYFPYLYSSRSDRDFPTGYPRLARYAGVQGRVLSITAARMVFRTDRSVANRPISVVCDEDRILLDDDKLPDSLFEVLVSMRSAVLPVRVGEDLFLEPYYPNRFARQFGLDQSVPSNRLSFAVSERRKCGVEDLLKAQIILYRRNTTSRFFIPRSSRLGRCSWWYCRWWLRSCTPYLGLSITTTFETLNQRPSPEGLHRVFVIQNLREVSPGLRQEVRISEIGKPKHQSSKSLHKSRVDDTYHKVKRAQPTSNQGRQKRLKSVIVADDNLGFSFEDHVPPFKEVALEELNPRSEKSIKMSDNPTPQPMGVEQKSGEDSDTHSGKTDLVDLDSDTSHDSCEEMVPGSLYQIFGPEMKENHRRFLLNEMQDILKKLTSTNSPQELLVYQKDTESTVAILTPMLEALGTGKVVLNWFSKTTNQIFVLASQLEQGTVVEKGVDIDLLRDLSRRQDMCHAFKKKIARQLSDSRKQLEKLKSREHNIIEAEKQASEAAGRAKLLRDTFETARKNLEEKISGLEQSSEEQDKLDGELRQKRMEAHGDKFPEFEHFQAFNETGQKQLVKLVDSLRTFAAQTE